MAVLIFDRSPDRPRKPGFTLQEGLPSASLSARRSFLPPVAAHPAAPSPPESSSLFPTCREQLRNLWLDRLETSAQSSAREKQSPRDPSCEAHLDRNLRADRERTCPPGGARPTYSSVSFCRGTARSKQRFALLQMCTPAQAPCPSRGRGPHPEWAIMDRLSAFLPITCRHTLHSGASWSRDSCGPMRRHASYRQWQRLRRRRLGFTGA